VVLMEQVKRCTLVGIASSGDRIISVSNISIEDFRSPITLEHDYTIFFSRLVSGM
jgi:hypothetical protein